MAELGVVMKELESMGTEQFRNTYRRHGAAEPLYGVSFSNLKAIARRFKRDHQLALELWESGNVDARSLATMLVDPALIDSKTADKWVGSLSYYMLVDLAANVVARSPVALAKANEWRGSDNEWVGQAGWDITAWLAMNDAKVPDAYFNERLTEIQSGIKTAKNRVRHAMNQALIGIGGARPALKARALGIARAIGKVVVDHGETGCVTPDATEYIAKMSERTEAAGGGVAAQVAQAAAQAKAQAADAKSRVAPAAAKKAAPPVVAKAKNVAPAKPAAAKPAAGKPASGKPATAKAAPQNGKKAAPVKTKAAPAGSAKPKAAPAAAAKAKKPAKR
jgi:3-methyladenine DNA glycosylase AlkD